MIGRRALVVTDASGVLEVFGPYEPEELAGGYSDLEVWAAESGDVTANVVDMPLRDPDLLAGWIEDPESFYCVGDEL